MKKLLLLAVLLGAVSSVRAADGIVAFANTGSPNFRLWTNNAAGTASNLMSGASAYRIGLYALQGAGQPAGSLQLIGLATNQASPALAGYFSGGNPFTLPQPYQQGDTITFQIRAWSLASGATYEAAAADPAAFRGQSALGQVLLGSVPAVLFGTGAGQVGAFGIVGGVIPEPSSIALGLLGLGAIALFRRRK